MKIAKISSALLLAVSILASFNASAVTAAAGSCAPLVRTKIAAAPYAALNTRLTNAVMLELNRLMGLVKDAATYNALAAFAKKQVAAPTGGRIVITTPDGTVAYDSSKANNSFATFSAKTINENHNSRVAIFDAQQYECGIGVETKLSTTDKSKEAYVAARLGLGTTVAAASYLNNLGTVRLSVKQ